MNSFRHLISALLNPIRKVGPIVIWTPEKIGLGNFLYLWLQASIRQKQGVPTKVLLTNDMKKWAKVFPRIFEDLVIAPENVKFLSPREIGWYQDFGKDFTADHLDEFLKKYVVESLQVSSNFRNNREDKSSGKLVANIRRGDYYSIPKFRGLYSFDIQDYLRSAMKTLGRDKHSRSEIVVVSDDIAWCQTKLEWLEHFGEVKFVLEDIGPIGHLRILAEAESLIITNSTFSYWGAYINGYLSNHNSNIVAPVFHSRQMADYKAIQLDPRWTIIEDIPGGWDS